VRLLYVPLKELAMERLRTIAERERRRPRDQAAVLLERALAAADPNHPVEVCKCND
jgi:hypothetical protein